MTIAVDLGRKATKQTNKQTKLLNYESPKYIAIFSLSILEQDPESTLAILYHLVSRVCAC